MDRQEEKSRERDDDDAFSHQCLYVCVCLTRRERTDGSDRLQLHCIVTCNMHCIHTKMPKSVNITMKIPVVDYSERRAKLQGPRKVFLIVKVYCYEC